MLIVDIIRKYELVWIRDANGNYGMMSMSCELKRNDI